MRRTAFALLIVLSLVLVPAVADQKRPKDEAMHQYLIGEFAQLNAKVGKLDDRLTALDGRLTALDAEVGQLKQQQKDLNTDLRDAQNILKSVDTSLGTLRLGSQQDLFSLKADVAQVRTELATLSDLIKKSPAAAAKPVEAAPTPPVAAAPALPEGYILTVDGNDVTINLGSNVSVNVGQWFNVFKASDPANGVGIIEITQVIDANNSKAKVISRKPDIKLEFSDIVRVTSR
jgi:hypothetical protein